MQFIRRFWFGWLLLAIIIVLIAWPGRLSYYQHLTVKEAARIEAITPETVAAHPKRLDKTALMNDLKWLAAPERKGRLSGSSGGLEARQYIIDRFESLGLIPAGTDGFEHPFQTSRTNSAANVMALIPGTHYKKGQPLKTIVLTAHYDHLGVHEAQIYLGADDNASGTSALLQIAAYLKNYPNRHPILLVATDHEERGLMGAKALFESGHLKAEDVIFNINLDMISRNTNDTLFAVGSYHSPWILPLIKNAQKESAVKLIAAHDRPKSKAGYTPDWTFSSDHGPFHQQGIPFIYLGVADHPDYHQPTDAAERVDEDFYLAASEAALTLLLLVDRVLSEK